jgi:hypothetical protein
MIHSKVCQHTISTRLFFFIGGVSWLRCAIQPRCLLPARKSSDSTALVSHLNVCQPCEPENDIAVLKPRRRVIHVKSDWPQRKKFSSFPGPAPHSLFALLLLLAYSSPPIGEAPVRVGDHALHRLGEHAAKLLDAYVGQLLALRILMVYADKHPVLMFVGGPASLQAARCTLMNAEQSTDILNVSSRKSEDTETYSHCNLVRGPSFAYSSSREGCPVDWRTQGGSSRPA